MHFATYAWFGERKVKFLFPSGISANAPRWGESEYPPLSPRAAAKAAITFLNKVLPDSGGSLTTYKLVQAWGPNSDDCYWYYAIEFSIPDPEDIGLDAGLLEIPVLFNGIVPEYILIEGEN